MSEISPFEELEKEIEKVRTDFFSESGCKNFLFKKQQKFDCAKQVTNKIPLDALLSQTVYIDGVTNRVHIVYPMLKLFASPEVFEIISEYIVANFQHIKATHNSLEVMLNLDGFTISAAERYKGLIDTFCTKCFNLNTGFSQLVSRFVVYNAPSSIESIGPIVRPFMEENVREKLIIATKKESDRYNQIFQNASPVRVSVFT